MTNDDRIIDDRVDSRSTNILGAVTTITIFAAAAGLVASWFLQLERGCQAVGQSGIRASSFRIGTIIFVTHCP
ncbi:hypothetical protein [Mesorhizobium sp. CA8]|uniref:hypothetical protein n=1 Tax=Mesorhizobium sp. CA8 TaxID=2876637 RepID=UPI001CCA941A|nr:hypothetical protein [Mesorhizobium sp. CA8]